MNGFSEKVSGSALVAGGACLAVFWAIISQFPSFAGADVVLDPLQLTAQGFHLAASPLLALGLVPLASRRMRPGVLTVLGVAATMAGLLGFFADGVIAAVISPILAHAHPAAIEADGAMFTGPIFIFYVATFATLMTGLLLCALGLARGANPDWAGIALWTVGGVMMNLPPMPGLHLVQVIGGVLLGGAFVLYGVRMIGEKAK